MFTFKRGDTVRICLVTYDKHGPGAKMIGVDEQYGIVLNADDMSFNGDKRINIRRDSDGSLFDCDINGKAFNINGDQFLQIQKCFLPVSSYKGTLVEWLEAIAHPSEHPDCVRLTVLGVVDGKGFKQEIENHFMDAKMNLDLSKSRGY